jgi:hypothetical protein
MINDLIDEILKTWPNELKKELTSTSETGKPIQYLMDEVKRGNICSLPYFLNSKNSVLWVTFGNVLKDLNMYVDGLENWLPGNIYNVNSKNGLQFISIEKLSGRLSSLIVQASPYGYYKWTSRITEVKKIIEILVEMQRFLSSRPQLSVSKSPTISSLRFAFASSLRIGNWENAASIIEEIDRWSLDQARKTLQMRIRLHYAKRDFNGLYDLILRNQAWSLTHPRRIASAILLAIDEVLIVPYENKNGFELTENYFRNEWHPRLIQVISDSKGESESIRIQSYAALVDKNWALLSELIKELDSDGLCSYFKSQFPNSSLKQIEVKANTSTLEVITSDLVVRSIGHRYWDSLHSIIVNGKTDSFREIIDSLDTNILCDIDFLVRAPDALLELFSDPNIESRASSRLMLQDAFASMIGVVIDAPGFPVLNHLDLYIALAEGLVFLKGKTASDEDSQLLLGLIYAISYLSPSSYKEVEVIVKNWWESRPSLSRLSWLLGSLDILLSVHQSPHQLIDIYMDALIYASNKKYTTGISEFKYWNKIGTQLEIDSETLNGILASIESPLVASKPDVLKEINIDTISIVSLKEASAKEAAKELKRRIGQNLSVNVITSQVSNTLAKNAENSDLILFVWSASTHAVYRSFDQCRDKLCYVQGTGASSIVNAAERWASFKLDHQNLLNA